MTALAAELIGGGLADDKMLDRARGVAESSGRRLDAVLTQLGIVGEREIAMVLSRVLDLPLTHVLRYPTEPVLPNLLGPNFLRRNQTLPLAASDECVVLAVADPLTPFIARVVAQATDREVIIEVAVPMELEAALQRLYPLEAIAATSGETSGGQTFDDDTERLKDMASEGPVIRLVNQIISRAVENRASDIHIEPHEDRLRIRFRYDGVLHEEDAPPVHLTPAIVSRIKIMAQLDIAERRLPQDGRVKLAVRGQDIDFRVSSIPSIYGETVVLRILDRAAIRFDFATLGLPAVLIQRLQELLDLPNGMVLVTGPTGSGKTTSLYTGLLGLNAVSRKIITVEDPVEYRLAGINQIQTKPQIGLTFAHLLRSILRQDPDVIMIGEIRDIETAQIAVQASLTGHMVLSTLHTNSAAASITRLRDMGLEEYLITAALKGILAQRLVRKLCPDCARATPAGAAVIDRYGLERFSEGRSIVLYHPVGCPQCRNTGYRGRQAIAELMVPDQETERLILSGASQAAIEQAAIRSGMRTMFETGLEVAMSGVTSIDEILRTMNADAAG